MSTFSFGMYQNDCFFGLSAVHHHIAAQSEAAHASTPSHQDPAIFAIKDEEHSRSFCVRSSLEASSLAVADTACNLHKSASMPSMLASVGLLYLLVLV